MELPVRLQDWIDEMCVYAEVADWGGLERKYLGLCAQLAGDEMAAWIRYLDFSEYRDRLDKSYRRMLRHLRIARPRAIYFEFDMPNDWAGTFFLCRDYLPPEANDDDWACDWVAKIDGPEFPKLTEVFQIDGGRIDEDPPARGKCAYLIARTLATLGRCIRRHPVEGICICAGFHGQDPVTRLQDPSRSVRR
jgi:hypothetical protein